MKYHIEIVKTDRYCYINAISDDMHERIGKVCVDFNSEDSERYKKYGKKVAKIILVNTSPSYCRQGIATALLNKTIEEFNDYCLYLNVIPLRSDKNRQELIDYYSKFEFKKSDEDICSTIMIKI